MSSAVSSREPGLTAEPEVIPVVGLPSWNDEGPSGILPRTWGRFSRPIDEEDGADETGSDAPPWEKLEKAPLVKLLEAAEERRFAILQQWEGVVERVNGRTIYVILADLTDSSRPDEEVELPLDEISEADRPLVGPGAIIYWCIGYDTSIGGQIRRVSEMRVRRMAAWSARVLASARNEGRQMLERMAGHNEDEGA